MGIDPNITSADLEYLEILNSTNQPVDLDDWRIRGGVDFDFSAGTTLAAGESIVVVGFNPSIQTTQGASKPSWHTTA